VTYEVTLHTPMSINKIKASLQFATLYVIIYITLLQQERAFKAWKTCENLMPFIPHLSVIEHLVVTVCCLDVLISIV